MDVCAGEDARFGGHPGEDRAGIENNCTGNEKELAVGVGGVIGVEEWYSKGILKC